MSKIKITPLAIALIILEIVLIFTAFYYCLIENNNGMALAGIIALGAAFLNALIFGFEQFIANIKGIDKKALWIIEILIIISTLCYVFVKGISIG